VGLTNPHRILTPTVGPAGLAYATSVNHHCSSFLFLSYSTTAQRELQLRYILGLIHLFDQKVDKSARNLDHVTNNVKRHTTMAVFSDLPMELRLKIWKMVPVSRNVVLSPHPDGFIKIRTQLLTVWHVCCEARTATLRAYTEIDCGQVVSQTKTMSIYIDFHLDRIIFNFFLSYVSVCLIRSIHTNLSTTWLPCPHCRAKSSCLRAI
jgi:hypothetical protein